MRHVDLCIIQSHTFRGLKNLVVYTTQPGHDWQVEGSYPFEGPSVDFYVQHETTKDFQEFVNVWRKR